jgi:hypothetical protein
MKKHQSNFRKKTITMNSHELLTALKNDVNEIISITKKDLANLPLTLLNKKQDQSSWSILECFEHLNRYCRYYNVAVAKKLVPGRAEVNPEVASTWLGRKSIAMMHPSNPKKQKTLKHLNPANGNLDVAVITEFLQHQQELLSMLDKAKTVDINRTKVPVEFFKLLSMTLGEALQFVIVHEQRHFIQLKKAFLYATNKEASLVV